jgi:cytosine/adenosine deaminase-related metal-dependent hydrolase
VSYRKFRADQLFTGYKLLSDEHILVTNEKGVIEDVISVMDAGSDIERFKGILSPGFINCHCHLELSHLKNVIPPHTGLIEFLCSVVQKREAPGSTDIDGETLESLFNKKIHAIEKAEKEMFEKGIVGVGDICNTSDAIDIKGNSAIRWHSFIEVISFSDEKSDFWLKHYQKVLQDHEHKLKAPHRNVLTPHAPYSISPETFKEINNRTKNQVISIHNQEHPAEDDLYKTGGGDLMKLFKIFGIEKSPFPVTGMSSLRSYLHFFRNNQTIFLVHNTYMPEEDVVFANNYADENGINLIYCLCPNANLYIENKLPPAEQFIRNHCNIVLGTDSYSSNWQLSIAKEIESVLSIPYFKNINFNDALERVLTWATINGARALQWDQDSGSFEKGKRPGVILIDRGFNVTRIL